MSETEKNKETGQNDFVESVNWPVLSGLIEEKIEEHEERSDPKQVRDVVSIDEWLSYYYIGSPSDTIYPFWEDTAKEFIKGGYNELIIDGSLGSGKCVHEDSMVYSPDGCKMKIKDFIESDYDEIYSLDEGTGEFVSSTVKDFIDDGEKPVYEVTTRKGRKVEVTSTHPFRTPFGWKSLDEGLEEGEKIATPQQLPHFGDKEVPIEKAELFGLMIAEGSMSGNHISFTNTDEEIVDVGRGIADFYGVDLVCRDEINYTFTAGQRGGVSNQVLTILRESGLNGKRSWEKFIPDEVFSWDKKYIKRVIEMLWNGDGWVQGDNTYAYSTASEELANDIIHLLLKFGLPARLYKKEINNGRPAYNIRLNGELARKFQKTFDLIDRKELGQEFMDKEYNPNCKHIPCSKELAEDISNQTSKNSRADEENLSRAEVKDRVRGNLDINTFELNPYALKNKGLKQQTFGELTKFVDNEELENIHQKDVYYDEIVSIEKKGEKQVYDLEVEGTHNFLVNDVVVHNTWLAQLIIMRKIYELSCYEYPQRLFGFSDNTKINFAYLSVKNNIARNTGFSDLKGHIEGSPYFQEEFTRDESIETKLRWPDRNIEATYGSTGSSIIGSNLLACVIDEANFWKRGGGDPGDVQAVRDVYKDATHRRRNRFMSDGEDPGFSILISSSSDAKSFIEQRKRNAGEGNYLHVKARNYKVKPWKYSDEKFLVFVGTDQLPPEIVSTPQQFKSILEDLDVDWQEIYDEGEIENLQNESYQNNLVGQRIDWLKNKLPDRIEDNFIAPPIEYKDDFDTGIHSALQDIGGEVTGESDKFFSNAQVWNECSTDEIEFSFTKEEFTIGMNSPRRISDYFKPHTICDFVEERDGKKYYKPKYNPGHDRYLHIDLSSSNDPTGIAMCHITGYEEGPDGEISLPELQYDFMVRLTTPEHPDRLDHQKIRKFIYRLRNRYGFTFRKIGMDKHASESNLQLFDKNVFNKKSNRGDDDYGSCYNSTDSSDDMWTDFVDLMYAGNVKFASYETFHQEFFGLENQGADNPPDHPDEFEDGKKGHNDVSCAVVGASSLAYSSDEDLSDRYTENQTRAVADGPQDNWKGSHGINPFISEKERLREQQDSKILDLHSNRS